MESRSYNFSTARKRSSQLAGAIIRFPREDDNAPRMKILSKECPDEYQSFKQCLKDNDGNGAPCNQFKEALNECGLPVFIRVNQDPNFTY